MKRHMRTSLKAVASIALALALCLCTALPVLAARDPSNNMDHYSIAADEDHPAKAAIYKVFLFPITTVIPKFTFTYTLTPVSVDGETSETPPPINAPTIIFDANSRGTINGNTERIAKESTDIVANVNWPHAGLYEYKLTENVTCGATLGVNDYMNYSKAEYKLIVYVDNGTNGLYVRGVVAWIVVNDTPGGPTEVKVDPTPGTSNINGEHSEMIFTNRYGKITVPPEQPDPDPTKSFWSVRKTVAGEGANLNKYFTFNLSVTRPDAIIASTQATAVIPTPRAYIYNIVHTYDSTGAIASTSYNLVTDISSNYTGLPATIGTDSTLNAQYIKVSDATVFNVMLKNNQKVEFTGLYVGTGFTVNEVGNSSYVPSYKLECYGTPPTAQGNGAAGASLAVIAPGAANGLLSLAEKNNSVIYTNTHSQLPITGITVDNLPYVVLIAVGVLALVAYLVIKTRKNSKSNSQTK